MATNDLTPNSPKLTRRNALAALGAGAVAVPALAAANSLRSVLPADHPDAVLLHHVAEFHRLYREADAANDVRCEAEEAAISHPDCPPLVSPLVDPEGHERWWAFMTALGRDDYDRWQELLEEAGTHLDTIFSTPAKTLPGAIEKLKIVRLVVGDSDRDRDESLEAFQDHNNPWLAGTITELERLAGGAS